MIRRFACAFALSCLTATLAAEPTGPTLQLDYGQGSPAGNSICAFMYFVPLIATGPSTLCTNVGNTQCARVLSFGCKTNGGAFTATCEFEFTGSGSLQYLFDPTEYLKKREEELKSGVVLKHQLGSIQVDGDGRGRIEVAGSLTNGLPAANKVTIHFAAHGRASPVAVNLQDFAYRDGSVRMENKMVARVDSLVFQRASGPPKMEVILASIKQKEAGVNLWQNFVGRLKGATANFFLPPLDIKSEGQNTMLDFGAALAKQTPTFTFPLATRLTGITNSAP
jgi:hypothetical protein